MKVSIYDETGQCVGVAWHEDREGVVYFPPATSQVLVCSWSMNDGPPHALPYPVLWPVDADMPFSVRRLRNEVDNTAPAVTWWGVTKRAWRWAWSWVRSSS